MDSVNTKTTVEKIVALLGFALFLLVVTVNALANILPINGVGTGQLSDEIPNLFVPAGLTFSVWGLIYLLLTVYTLTVLFQAFRKGGSTAWTHADGLIFSLNMAANAAWIFSWHYRLVPLSLLIMLVIFGTLLWLEERNATRLLVGKQTLGSNKVGRFLLTTPINVYLGWICVATIANVTAVFVTFNWDGFGLDPRAWTVAVIIAGMLVGLLLIFLRKAVAAPLVIVWAYAGIVIKRTQTDGDYSGVIWVSAIVAAAVLVIAIGAKLLASGRKSQ